MQNIGQESCAYGRDDMCEVTNEIKEKQLPQLSGVRPMVDPEAEGNVDPHLYPQPKEATHKIRGKNDIIEYLFGSVDQELLTVKTFYFFFYSAFGSLFPLMGVYFKQMGMNAGQCGLLIGLRPFIEFFSAPFWGSWADRWRKGKIILLASLSCWIIFTLPLGFIQPPATSCLIYKNHSSYLYIPDSDQKIVKRSTDSEKKSTSFENLVEFKDLNGSKNSKYLYSVHTFNIKLSHEYRYEDHILDYNNRRKKKGIDDEPQTYNRTKDIDDKRIDVEELIKYKRPIDIRQYKKFLKNEEFDQDEKDFKPPKKGNDGSKVRMKSTPTKIMIKLETSIISPQISGNMHLYKKTFDTIQNFKSEYDHFNKVKRNININNHDTSESVEHTMHTLRKPSVRVSRSSKLQSTLGLNPISVNKAVNYKETEHRGWVKPAFSSIVYKLPDIQKTFFLLLLLVIVGEFFAAPAITLADSAVITLLGEDADRYGHQRMFGSLGWGLAMFFVGIALDHSTAFPDHPCGPDPKEKNYTICFAIFSVLMGAALITATQINFKYEPILIEPETKKTPIELTREEQLQNQLSQQLNLPSLQASSTATAHFKPQPPEGKTKMFAQTTREIPEWIAVLKQFKDLKCASFLFVAWFMGFGIGLIFTFLFWHLQDYGGTPTLFGVASVINHISEIFAYFFSFKLIRQMGHVKVLCLGLGGNVLRFLYISWLKNPWWVLPFEFMQGITHAAVWAACCSYISHNTPTPLRPSAQGVLQGLHHGLGRGCGAVIGGLFVAIYGTTLTFRVYGLICLIVLAAFVFINFYRKDTGFVSDLPQAEDPHQVAEVTHLAPHGVPSNAMPRALSSNRLHELANQESSYGATYQTSSTNLNVPGGERATGNPNNPFLNSMKSDAYGYMLTNKDSEEYIKTSFQAYNEILGKDFDKVKIPPLLTHAHPQQPCTNPFHQHNYDW